MAFAQDRRTAMWRLLLLSADIAVAATSMRCSYSLAPPNLIQLISAHNTTTSSTSTTHRMLGVLSEIRECVFNVSDFEWIMCVESILGHSICQSNISPFRRLFYCLYFFSCVNRLIATRRHDLLQIPRNIQTNKPTTKNRNNNYNKRNTTCQEVRMGNTRFTYVWWFVKKIGGAYVSVYVYALILFATSRLDRIISAVVLVSG